MDIKDIPPLNVSIRRAVSNNQVYEVINEEELSKEINKYVDRDDIGVLLDYEDTQVVLPLRHEENFNPITPGVYVAKNSPIGHIKMPDESNAAKYIPDKVVSISNLTDVQDMIKRGEEIKHLDEPFITTPDDITKIPINPDDQPEMVCLKTAINAKNVDFDKYAIRFSSNFPNDKRQLRNQSVTLNIIKRFCQNMDMEALLTLRDTSPDVPNPIGRDITVSLTADQIDEDDGD